jgi:hypothetical protein
MQARGLTSIISSGLGRVALLGALLSASACKNNDGLEKAELNPALQNHASVKGDNFDSRIAVAEAQLHRRNLLDLHNELYDLYEIGSKTGRAVRPQELLGKRLEAEVFPVLHSKIFSGIPDEVIIAEFTEPGIFDAGGDFGRGLRVIFRKKIGEYNTSTIMFLDYNEKTKRVEFPHDIFYKEHPNLVPDAMRMLVEYDVKPPVESLKSKQYDTDWYTNTGFIGTTISARLEPRTGRLRRLEIYPASDSSGEPSLAGNASFWGCMGCHTRQTGFFGDPSISYFETQRDIHLHQDKAIDAFLKHVGENKHFDSPQEKTQTLERLGTQLRSPKENLDAILPTGFLDVLGRQQEGLVHRSSILRQYSKN